MMGKSTQRQIDDRILSYGGTFAKEKKKNPFEREYRMSQCVTVFDDSMCGAVT